MQLKFKIFSFWLFSTFLCVNFFAQQKAQDFNFVSIREGISKVGIYTITQDHYGFIWIGTNGSGLYKFDGIDYTSYKFKNQDSTSLNSNLIFSSYLSKKNNLWIGTEDGLNLYDRNLDQFIDYKIDDLNGANISVLSINEKNNKLYIGTGLYGLFELDLETKKTRKIFTNDNTYPAINSIKIDKDGVVFLGTSLGLRILDTIKFQIVKPSNPVKEKANIFDKPIQSLLIDSRNNLWAGTYNYGVYKYVIQNKSINKIINLPLTQKRILSLVELDDSSLLVGSENDGLFHLSLNGDLIKNYTYNKIDKNSIRSNSIWSLFVDKNKRIWMGYYNKGVDVSDKLYNKFNKIESLSDNKNSLQTGSVSGIVKDNSGKLWVTMDGGGIDVVDVATSKVKHINANNSTHYSGITSDYFQTIFIDSKQTIWAGSWDNGIFFLKKGEKKFRNINIQNSKGKLLSNAILSIVEDKDGIIWIGTFYKGLYSYNSQTKQLTHYNTGEFVKYNISTSDVRKIIVDSEGVIWAGTTSGLFRIKKQKDGRFKIKSYVKPMSNTFNNHKSSIHLLSLFESKNGFIWVGTRGAGLYRYDKKKDEFKWYNKLLGLNEENIASIIEDEENNIWVGGNSGISKINTTTKKVTNFTINDGLLSDDFNFNSVLKDENEVLYFGSYKGINYFNPKKMNINTSVPSLYLTDLKIFNKRITPNTEKSPLSKTITETKSLELPHNHSVFTLEYTGINYTRPEKNQYAYYLEGLEKTWNYVGNKRSTTYTNLDYGDYVFKLKAANNDGVWNPKSLELKITILPPWRKTNWAISLYILFFILGILLLNKVTNDRIKQKELIKSERYQRVQEEALHKKKLQFFTNISHEFRTPLTLILNPLKDLMRDQSLNVSEIIKSKHHIIYKNADRLYRLINELMDLRKLELDKVRIKASSINLVTFTKNIINYFKDEALNRNIFLSVDTDIANIEVWVDESMLEKIIFNILSNALKVTPDNGSINIILIDKGEAQELPLYSKEKKVKVVEIAISDTGSGLEKDQVNKIFERFYQIDNLNKTYYGSTGIGLEVVNNFVMLHKGKIEVDSVVNEGTTFNIILPKGREHFTEDQIKSFKKEEETPKIDVNFLPEENNFKEIDSLGLEKKKTILIVEDNTELRKYLKTELSKTYKVLSAKNGVKGLEIAQKTFPDVILTDVIMPEMDGFEFCKRIKTDIKTSHIPLLMLTAKARIDDRIEGIEYGSDAYMTKPFDMRLLTLRLSQLITSRKLIFDKYFGEVSGANENTHTNSIDKEFINKVLDYIGQNISDSKLNVEQLANELNLSRSQLYRKIKSLTGKTANELIKKVRLERARQILETGSAYINEVGYKVGFSSPSYFTKCFKEHFGVLPTEIEVKE